MCFFFFKKKNSKGVRFHQERVKTPEDLFWVKFRIRKTFFINISRYEITEYGGLREEQPLAG